MAENEGGLNYKINVSGDFDKVFDRFERRVKQIEDRIKKAGASGGGGKPNGGGGSSRPSSTDPVARKQKQLTDSIAVAQAKILDLLEAQNRIEKKIAKNRQAGVIAADKGLRTTQAQVDADALRLKQSEKLARNQVLVNKAQTKGAKTVTQIAEATRLSAKEVSEVVGEQAAFEESAKAQLKSQQAFNKERGKEADLAKRQQEYNDINYQAQERINALRRKDAITQKAVNQYSKEQKVSVRRAAEELGVASAQAKRLKLNLFDAEHAARQFLFTFRRLVGILAVFTAARELANALARGVKEMSRFNAELETAEIGIASIVASVGKITDSQGHMVTGADAFAVAMDASRDIVQGLKKDAIGSIATFEGLVKAYQVAVGPGLEAGLDLGQIREVSKRLAEGALTLGVPLNQLSEEIRSLLQGTATARNTRIAVLFGGAKEANEAIRNAKEQGNLFEVLNEKLSGIKQGASAAALSMNVLKSNLQDTVQILLAEGGIEYFTQMKDATLALTDALKGGDGKVFSPEALGIVQEVAGTLASITQSFRDLTDTGQGLILIRNVLATIGDAIKIIAPLVSGVFQGLATGANLALAPLRLILDSIRTIAGKPLKEMNKALSITVKYLTAGAVALFLWSKYAKLAAVWISLKKLVVPLKAAVIYMGFLANGVKGVTIGTALAATTTNSFAAALRSVWVGLGPIGIALLAVSVVVGVIVTKTKLLEKVFGKFNKELSDTDKKALDLEHSISSAGDATAEGAKSAKDWADEFRKLDRDLAKARGIKGLADSALAVNTLVQDMVESLTKGTYRWEAQKEAAQEVLATAKDELKVLKEQEDQLKQINKLRSPLLGTTPGAGFMSVSYGADTTKSEELKINRSKVDAERRLKEAKAEIAEITRKEIKALEKQTEILEEQRSITVRRAEDKVWESEREKEIADILQAKANVSVKELAARVSQNTVRKAEIDLAQKVREEGIKTAQAELLAAKARRDNQAAYYMEQYHLLKSQKKEQGDVLASLAKGTAEYKKQATELGVTEAKMRDASASFKESVTSSKALTRQEEELNRIRNQNIQMTRDETRELEEQRAELLKQQKILSGDFTTALSTGLEQFASELPALGDQIAETVSGALTDLSGVVAGVFKDAIDPRTDADLKTAFGEFFLDLAGQFVEAITSQLIADSLSFLNLTPETDTANVVATNANTSALQQLNATIAATSASEGAGAGADATAAALTSSASSSNNNTAAAANAGAMAGEAGKTNPLILAALLPILISIITAAFKDGGQVKGYASGGSIGDSFPRPSHIPASDTVRAWLTPGEYVIKKDIVKKFGVSAFNAINSGGARAASALKSIMNPSSFAPAAFALGGPVGGLQNLSDNSMSGRGQSAAQTKTVIQPLPVMISSEKNADQIFTGGRRALTNNVNKVHITGDPNAKGGW